GPNVRSCSRSMASASSAVSGRMVKDRSLIDLGIAQRASGSGAVAFGRHRVHLAAETLRHCAISAVDTPPPGSGKLEQDRGQRGEPTRMSTSTWIILGIIAALVVWVIMVYNGLVAMRQRVSQAFADIDVQLKQRHDLIPNLIETVKGYAAHERGTLDAVIQARNAAITAQGPAAQAQAENQLSG